MELTALDIPTVKINQFKKKGISTVEDLARFLPRKYYDFRNIISINQVKDGEICAVVGIVHELQSAEKYFKIKIKDASGWHMSVIWFMPSKSQGYLKYKLQPGVEFIFCGKIQINTQYKSIQMLSPFCFSDDIDKYQRIVPVYSKIPGMADEFLLDSINSALALVDKFDYIEPILLNKFNLVKNSVALRHVHQPNNEQDIEEAKKRFVFDDLFVFGMQLAQTQQIANCKSKYVMPNCSIIKTFLKTLSFELTEGQKEVLKQICQKMRAGERVNSLVQGDVGSGKTIVAIILMLIAYENGLQSALMCPTNVLAEQHYKELLERTKDTSCKVAFLSGDVKAKQKKEILKGIETGEINIVVGTHAVIQNDVKFKNLALTVVDEEHRFGVVQRNLLKAKAKEGVHNITMSATPIPRTLAMTIYGDNIDVLTITSMPKGRHPVQTFCIKDETKAYEAIYRQIKEGRQCYVVCPLIEDSDSEVMEGVESVETTHNKMLDYYKRYPTVKISMISGRMKPDEVAKEIDKFAKNEVHIMISTTIIEVGVNVPNASVMLVKNAERFGLSQLHQLRGRVGRGMYQSYCVLMSEQKDNPKLKVMCETTDGFKIAEEDLKLRGAGDFIGTKQSGTNKYIMLMLSNPDLFTQIKTEINEIYANPIRLNRYNSLNEIDISDK